MTRLGFTSLGAQLREDLTRHAEVDKASEARTRRQLLARMAAVRAPRRAWTFAAAGALLAAATAALFFWAAPAARQEPLRFWVEERTGNVSEWVTARDAEQSLRFSDGSSIVAGPHTTTRVMQISPDGAELTLERGRVDAHVVHRDTSRWQVAAGPFVVHVTGTRFRVNWDPQAEKLAVSVSEGRVEVTGGGQPLHELTAGSALELSVSASTELKSAFEAPTEPAAGPASEAVPDSAAPDSARDEDELIRPRKALEHKPDFRELSTAGRYREALAAVEQLGFSAQCESLGARDLLTLGSTARLAGRSDLASAAYQAARRRFPSSSEAGISAFSLGRLASDGGHASDAIGWFKRYLTEQPSGPLAREAAGRLIELLRQTGSTAQTREAAESYLKRYPTGPHAALARSVLTHP
ncbi:MAG TPA: FecR domain-containing protein [Polyangiaceae bacterium]|nr:FecR domain-containing protein [Polyangiaceae bacterium]